MVSFIKCLPLSQSLWMNSWVHQSMSQGVWKSLWKPISSPYITRLWLAFLAVSKRAILTRATRVLDMLGKFKRKDKLCSCLWLKIPDGCVSFLSTLISPLKPLHYSMQNRIENRTFPGCFPQGKIMSLFHVSNWKD